jgi:nucleoside-diphosphate-sugar epimerase
MRILVIGGSGFLGKRVIERLVQLEYDVSTAVRSYPLEFVENCKYILVEELLKTTDQRFDVIINVAMKRRTRHAPVSDEELIELNFETPFKMISQLSTNHTLIINTSTYIQNFKGIKGNTVEGYGYCKERLSQSLEIEAEKSKFKVVDLYLFTLFGPGDRATHLVPTLLTSLLTGQSVSLSEGKQLINLVYVDDAVESIMKCIALEFEGYSSYCLWEPNYQSIRNLVSTMENIFVRKLDVVWGAVPYSGHEMFEPWEFPQKKFPNLMFDYSLTEGLKECYRAIELSGTSN